MKSFTLLITCLSILAACNNIGKQANKTAITKLHPTDAALISTVYESSLYDIKLAEEAYTRSTSIEAKRIAETIINDHHKIMDDIEEIAGEFAAELPLDISETHMQQWRQMVQVKGRNFDLAFLDLTMKQHEATQSLFKKVSSEAKEPRLKKAAEKYMSLAHSHHQQAGEVRKIVESKQSRDTTTIVLTKAIN